MTRYSGLDIYFCFFFLKCSAASFGEKLPAFRRSSVTSFSGSNRPHCFGLLDPEDKVTEIIRKARYYLRIDRTEHFQRYKS